MYRLPKDIDLSFLKGLELSCFSIAYQWVSLIFDDANKITIQAKFTVSNSDGDSIADEPLCEIAGQLPSFLGKKIVDLKPAVDGTLILNFEDGNSIDVKTIKGTFDDDLITIGERTDSFPGFNAFSNYYRFQPVSENETEVIFETHYKPSSFFDMLKFNLISLKLGSNVRKSLKQMKLYAETQE